MQTHEIYDSYKQFHFLNSSSMRKLNKQQVINNNIYLHSFPHKKGATLHGPEMVTN